MASNFEFYSPTRVIFGKGTEQRVGALVREYGGTRVLIVYGGKSAVRSGVLLSLIHISEPTRPY